MSVTENGAPATVTPRRRRTREPDTIPWAMAKTLLVGALVALAVSAWLAFTPLRNPGIQDCGTALGFVVFNRPDLKATPGESPEATRLSLQPTCRERAVPQLQRAAIAFAAFVGLALLGAVLGLIDDWLAYRRAPRFEALLRERPEGAPGSYLRPPPLRDRRELGRALPPFELLDVVLLAGIGGATALGLVWLAGRREVVFTIDDVRWAGAGVVVGAVIVGHLVAAAQLVLTARGQVGMLAALEVSAAATFAEPLLPPLGPLGFDAHYLARHSGNRSPDDVVRRMGGRQLAGVLGFGAVALVAIAGANLGALPHVDLPDRWPFLAVAVVLFTLVGVSRASDRLRRLPVRPAWAGLRDLAREPGGTLDAPAALAAAVALPLANVLAFGAAVAALGGEPGFWRMSLVALAAMVAQALVPTPGGVGGVECTAVFGLLITGMPLAPAVVAVLLWRLLAFWLPLLAAGLPFRRLRRAGAI